MLNMDDKQKQNALAKNLARLGCDFVFIAQFDNVNKVLICCTELPESNSAVFMTSFEDFIRNLDKWKYAKVLFTNDFIVNPNYEKELDSLFANREQIMGYNIVRIVNQAILTGDNIDEIKKVVHCYLNDITFEDAFNYHMNDTFEDFDIEEVFPDICKKSSQYESPYEILCKCYLDVIKKKESSKWKERKI